MSEGSNEGIAPNSEEGDGAARATPAPPPKKVPQLRPPWKPGQSGNPKGRPKIEPRVRRYARRYDQQMCRVLASIAQDEKAPMSERRKAAMDLIAVGSGRPELVQQITGRNGEQLGPLVALNFAGGMQSGRELSPADAYKLMTENVIEADPRHPAFERPALEQPANTAEKTEDSA
jgi:uncharacterized protein DUF5681